MKSLSSITLVADKERSQRVKDALSGIYPDLSERISKLVDHADLGLEIEVHKKKPHRSRPQENYYRKWEREFAKFCGTTQDEMHEEILCQAFGSESVETKFGIKRRPLKRSSKTSLKEYAQLIETLIVVSAEMGFAVPPSPTPDEYEEYANG